MVVITAKSTLSQSLREFAPILHEIWEARAFTVGTVLGLATIFTIYYIRSPWRKLPPGPRRLPLIGNIPQLLDKRWLLSKDCKGHFGEIMYLDAAGQPMIMLNSVKSVFELLEHRTNNYSDRPRAVMAQEILCNGLLFSLMNDCERWRRMRRAAHEALTKRAVQDYHPIQTKEATILVSSLLTLSASVNPEKHFSRLATSTIMSILYDYPTIMTEHDDAVNGIEAYLHRLGKAILPGSYFVNIFPWMVHIPERFARWKREARKQFAEDYAMFKGLLNRVRVDLANGGNRPSFSASLIQNHERNRLSEPEMSYLAGLLYFAGAETNALTLSWWALAMVAFPHVQRKAQAELDAVVGRGRLPTFADAPRLPYVRAIVDEVLRWRPTVPLGMDHAATEDDWYEGMFIPKGTICTPNIWNCNHDRTIFGEDADEFRPERHLDEHDDMLSGTMENVRAGHTSFGFGRRICIGQHLANNTLFISTARMLWGAKLEGVRDENGKEVPLDMDTLVHTGLVCRPAPYECIATPRFPEVMSILAEECERFES